jgi:chaperonin GroEL
VKVGGDKDLRNIASISANNDPVIGKMIADVFKKVGKDGAVRLEETQMTDTVVDVIEGCQFGAGYLSPNFVNNAVKKTADYKDAAILITDKTFQESFTDLHPAIKLIVEKSNEQEKSIPILIICGGMDGETLGTLGINKVKNQLPVVAVSIPDFGAERMEILDDIAVITGGTVITEERGLYIKDMTLEQFGTADRVIVDSATTTLIGRHGEVPAMQERVKEIEAQLKDDKHAQATWRLKKRIATITGGVGVIYVGGNSESEMKNSYYRIEDALAATKAALEDGYVPGGGVAYLLASKDCARIIDNRDQDLGYTAVLEALRAPLKVIAENCGEDGAVVVNKVLRSKAGFGYDALEGKYGYMVARGIIDPTKVVKTAIKNAASVAGMLITTNCVITDKPKK